MPADVVVRHTLAAAAEAQEAFHARTLAISESPELLGAGCQVVGSILSVLLIL